MANVLIAAVMMAAVVNTSAFAEDDLSGQWTVQWGQDPKNVNDLSISAGIPRLSGTYVNDSKVACSVTGNLQNERVAFQIVCPDWDIRMQGTLSKNRRSITGQYNAYASSAGQFTMTKQ